MPAVEIADRPLCGLAICHPDMDASEMAEKLARAGLDVTQTAMTYSTANLLDITPAGIDKSTGVSRALLTSIGIVGGSTAKPPEQPTRKRACQPPAESREDITMSRQAAPDLVAAA